MIRQGKQTAVNILEDILTKLNQRFPEDLVAGHRSIQMVLQCEIRHKCCCNKTTEAAKALHIYTIDSHTGRKLITDTKLPNKLIDKSYNLCF